MAMPGTVPIPRRGVATTGALPHAQAVPPSLRAHRESRMDIPVAAIIAPAAGPVPGSP